MALEDTIAKIITLWIFLGVVSVMVASHRGERAYARLVLLSISGPVGLALTLKKKKVKVFCPYCAELVDTTGGTCSLCGLNLDRIGEIEQMIVSKQCPQCGRRDVHDAYLENGTWGKWCPNCKKSIKRMRDSVP